ncbi:MAG: hypothetical protein V3U24_11245 [Candidatus Neomarinimicrobiota bacterium]
MIVLTFLVVGGFVIQPLLMKRVENPSSGDASATILNRQKEVIYKQIKEAEMEFEMGNLAKEDFERTRNQLKEEATHILQKMRKTGEKSV